MDDELKEFRDMFFEEAGENLQTLGPACFDWSPRETTTSS